LPGEGETIQVRSEGLIVGRDATASEDEMYLGVGALQGRGGGHEAGVILHGIEAGDEPDGDGVMRDRESGAHVPAHGAGGPEHLSIEAIGDEVPFPWLITHVGMNLPAGLGVDDNGRRQARKVSPGRDCPAIGRAIVA